MRLPLLLCAAVSAAAQIHIDAGSASDRYFSGGFAYTYPGLPAGAPLPTMRYGPSFSYVIPLAPGDYAVSLSFVERIVNAPGQHVFTVSIDGSPVLQNLDLFALTGANVAYTKTVPVTVSTSALALVISFSTVTRNAIVNRIDIVPVPKPPPPPPPSGAGSYTVTFTGQLTLSIPAAVHKLTGAMVVACYAADGSRVQSDSVRIDPGTLDVSISFATPQDGRCSILTIPGPVAAYQPSGLNLAVVAVTSTQTLFRYTPPNTKPCSLQVSDSNSFSRLVHDVDPVLFPGADLDSRLYNVSAHERVFVVGRRFVDKGSDGLFYSRALAADTAYFYRLSCGTVIANGSFRTANIPFSTYNDPPQIDTNGNAVVPTFLADRTTPVTDPQTGAVVKSIYLPGDSNIPYNYDGASFGMCGHQLINAPDGTAGFLCSFPTRDGGPGTFYYIVPATGEARFLGQIWIGGTPTWPAGGATNLPLPYPDASDPLVRWTTVGYDDKQGTSGEILVKIRYAGDFTGVAPKAFAPISQVNMTPPPHFIPALMHDFDPSFEVSKFGNCAVKVEGKYAMVECRRSSQGSYAWYGVIDMGDRQPLGSCTDCLRVIAATNGVANPASRWTTSHGSGIVAFDGLDIPLARLVPAPFEGSGPFLGPYATSLVEDVDAAATTITVAGEPLSTTDNLIEPFLMPVEAGDILLIGNEYVGVNGKAGNAWSVTRAVIKSDYMPPTPHSAGDRVTPIGERQPDGFVHYIWWKFLEDPHGTAGGYIPEANNEAWGGHADMGPNLYVQEAYTVRMGPLMIQINQPTTMVINPTTPFAGISAWAWGNAYTRYPTFKQTAPAAEQNYFLDLPSFIGGDPYSMPGPMLVAGTQQIYKYKFCSNGACGGNSSTLHRKQLATLAVSGGRGLTDVSGPGSVLPDGPAGAGQYCVPNLGGECAPGSAIGDAYINAPGVTSQRCESAPGFITNLNATGGNDLCLADLSGSGQGAIQFSLIPSTTGYGRKLSMGFGGIRGLGRIIKTLPDGSWSLFNDQQGHMLLLKMPPFVKADNIDRSTFVRAPIPLSAPAGAVAAAVWFGYAENGAQDQHYCTSRREACVATSAVVDDANPFRYEQTETFTPLPCPGTCTIMLPVLPGHVAYFQVKYFDAAGQSVGTGEVGAAAEATVVRVL